jgi:hypothetical protein
MGYTLTPATRAEKNNCVTSVIKFYTFRVFEIVDLFAKGNFNAAHWVGVIEAVEV